MTGIWKLYGMFQAFVQDKDIYVGQPMIKNTGSDLEQRTEITDLCLDPTEMNLSVAGKDFSYNCDLGAMSLVGAEPGKYLEIRDDLEQTNYRLMMKSKE